MKKSSMKGIFLLAVILAAVLSLFYRKTEEEGLLQTGKELEEELPICRVQTKEQNIALTFEVTYETDQVSEILELLAQHGGGASFFVTGKWAAEHTELAERILEQGCDVGFLGYECHDMSLLKETEAREELERGKEQLVQLQQTAGVERKLLFRPPYGEVSDQLLRAARIAGFTVIGWNTDSMDWKDYGTDAIVKLVLQKNQLRSGSILRFSAEARDTPEALPRIFAGLKQSGYQAVSVSELLE